MSNFECPVVRVTIESHDNADSLEIARVGGFMSIVKKGQYKTGDLAVYIPEQAILPEWLLKTLGFWDDLNNKGKLSGGAGNRVKAMKLRGVLSQGLLVALLADEGSVFVETDGVNFCGEELVEENQDAAEFLGITKYEPHVPAHMAGRVAGGDLDATIGYDFENIKKFPTLFTEGEQVVITEKIHGTFVQVGLIPQAIYEGKSWAEKMPTFVIGREYFKGIVTSKGQGAKGLLLDTADESNLYVKIARTKGLWDRLIELRHDIGVPGDKPIFICGEIFGPGVQDGFAYGQDNHAFRAFDIYVGTRSDGYYLDFTTMNELCNNLDIQMVPVLYRGPFNAGALALHTNGVTYLTANNPHMREGGVVKTVRESKHPKFGRKIAKSISEAYLLRKGSQTEFT